MNAKYSAKGARVHYCGANYFKARIDFDAWLTANHLPLSTHAGIPDTSELMYLGEAQYIRKDKIVAGDPVLAPGQKRDLQARLVNNGVTGDPRPSTPEIGVNAYSTCAWPIPWRRFSARLAAIVRIFIYTIQNFIAILFCLSRESGLK